MNKLDADTLRTDIAERLARLEEKHDAHVEMTREIKVMLQMQNGRVNELEKRQSWLMGGLGMITFIFSALVMWIKGGSSG